MSHTPHPHDKKSKKLALLKKNRFQQEFFNFVRGRKLEAERIENLADALDKPKHEQENDDKIWSEKVATISNRLNGKKRDSKERWNRFAGTEGGGGRGL